MTTGGRHLLAFYTAVVVMSPGVALACVGDCDGDGSVGVDEIILGVNIALDLAPPSLCRTFDRNGSNAVEIDELIAAVDVALSGCQAQPSATATTTPVSTSTPTKSTPLRATSTSSPMVSSTVTATVTATAPAFCTHTPIVPQTPRPSSACIPAPGRFADCFESSGLDTGHFEDGENGAAVADIDGDGFPDVFFWNTAGGAGLFRNLGQSMQFESLVEPALVWPTATTVVVGAAFGDLDNDRRADLVVVVDKTLLGHVCQPGDPLNTFHVYRNIGEGKFEEVTAAWGFGQSQPVPSDKPSGVGLSLVDLNLDGRLDILKYHRNPDLRPLVFLSQPDGITWQEAGRDVFGDARGPSWNVFFTDFDRDQLLDAFILNDYYETAPSRYYRRVGRSLMYENRPLPPVFGDTPFGSPMGAATADLNGDGQLDLVVSDTGDQHVYSLGLNVEGEWGVKQNPSRYGIQQTCWSIAVIDLENDGKPDLFFTCAGFRIGIPDKAQNFVLRNTGGVFENAGGWLPDDEVPTWDVGLAVADFDQDGRVDLLTGGDEHSPKLLWNTMPGGRALAIRLKGRQVNAEGIGARVLVEAEGLPTQVREQFPGGPTWGYGDSQLLFGMGQATTAHVTVDWRPAGGTAIQTVELSPGARVIEEP